MSYLKLVAPNQVVKKIINGWPGMHDARRDSLRFYDQ